MQVEEAKYRVRIVDKMKAGEMEEIEEQKEQKISSFMCPLIVC